MFFSLVNLEGKTLDTFRDEALAHEALRAVVRAEPTLIEDLLLLRNEDDGEVAGSSLMYEDLPPAGAEEGITIEIGTVSGAIDTLTSTKPMTAALGYFVGKSRPTPPAAIARGSVETLAPADA